MTNQRSHEAASRQMQFVRLCDFPGSRTYELAQAYNATKWPERERSRRIAGAYSSRPVRHSRAIGARTTTGPSAGKN